MTYLAAASDTPSMPDLSRAEAAVRRVVAENHDRPSLVIRIACGVGAEIVEGLRSPGDDLNSVDLARLYGTSRTPIREALMVLEKEGLVDIPPRRRPRVAVHDLSGIGETYLVRGALYAHLAQDVARRASDEELRALRPLLETMADACRRDNIPDYVWANVAFYDHVSAIGHNRTVKRMLETLLLRTLPFRRMSLGQPGRLKRSLDDHTRLVAAFIDRDGDLAAALLRANNRQALAVLERALAGRVNGRG